jgi:hypothetical protein
MLLIDGMGQKNEQQQQQQEKQEENKTFYCPLKANRQVDDSGVRSLTGEWMSWNGAKRSFKRASS